MKKPAAKSPKKAKKERVMPILLLLRAGFSKICQERYKITCNKISFNKKAVTEKVVNK